MSNISKSLFIQKKNITSFYKQILITANGSILFQDTFWSVLNRSGNDSGTIKNINNKSNRATPVPKKL